MSKAKIQIPKEQIVGFCRRHQIRNLSLFGSVLRNDFDKESDIDILIEFKPGKRIGLFGLTALEFELSEIIGHKVDLNTPGFISKYFRDQILAEREVQYAEA